jgi:hypothetical protein
VFIDATIAIAKRVRFLFQVKDCCSRWPADL